MTKEECDLIKSEFDDLISDLILDMKISPQVGDWLNDFIFTKLTPTEDGE